MIGLTCPRCQKLWYCEEADAGRARLCPACTQSVSSAARPGPPSILGGVFGDLAMWAAVIFVTMIGGMWLGVFLGTGHLVSAEMIFNLLTSTLFAWLIFPQFLIALIFTFVAWWLGLRLESTRLRIGIAAANFAVWLIVTAWVYSFFR